MLSISLPCHVDLYEIGISFTIDRRIVDRTAMVETVETNTKIDKYETIRAECLAERVPELLMKVPDLIRGQMGIFAVTAIPGKPVTPILKRLPSEVIESTSIEQMREAWYRYVAQCNVPTIANLDTWVGPHSILGYDYLFKEEELEMILDAFLSQYYDKTPSMAMVSCYKISQGPR